MTTYPLTPQATANETEQGFALWVCREAEALAKQSLHTANAVEMNLLAPAFKGVSLEGLRPEWLATQAQLSALVVNFEQGKVSEYATLCEKYEGALYGFAVTLLEAYARRAIKTA